MKQNFNIDLNNRKSLLIFTIVFSLIGLALLGGGIYSFISNRNKNNNYIAVEAKVVDYAEKQDDEGNLLYSMIVEYEVNGKTYKTQSKTSSNITLTIGSPIEIKYNPNNPNDIIFKSDIMVAIILSVMGVVFLIITAAITFSKRGKNND